MTFTVSQPVRIAAIVGLVAAVVIGAGLTMLGRKGGSTSAAPHVIKHHPFGPGAAKKAAMKAPAAKRATPAHKTQSTKASPKKATPPTTPRPAKPSAVAQALAAGLPRPLATALGAHGTVVVALYDPYSTVDAISFAEARAGAQLARVGFVPLDVLSKADVGGLTEKLGLLPDPGILVYIRPGTLVGRLSGFADKETVAQLAHNARPGT